MAKFFINPVLAILAAGLTVTAASAQRSPEYHSLRTSGAIGEQVNGYLGAVAKLTPSQEAIMNHINNQRRHAYTDGAKAENSTIQKLAFRTGCKAILRTVPGEKYQTPNGQWATRTSAAPIRDSRCI